MSKQQNKALKKLTRQRDGASLRFPLLFTLLGTFGVSTTYYGIQRIIDKVPFLANNPYIALGVGLAILLATGTLYKRLG